jgi:hypothetical protein
MQRPRASKVIARAGDAAPPRDDAHIKATVLAIADELKQAGLVLRYRVEGTGKVSLFCMQMRVSAWFGLDHEFPIIDSLSGCGGYQPRCCVSG